jgi:hypothetical protein
VNGFLYEAFRPEELRDRMQRFVDDPPLALRMAAAAPPVKPIVVDAGEWEQRYASVRAVRSRMVQPV